MVAIGLVGCADEHLTRLPVGGLVTRDSEQLKQGTISFLPGEGAEGPAATTGITDGRYQFDRINGPLPGLHKVMIMPQLAQNKMHSKANQTGSANNSPAATWTGEAAVSPDELIFDFEIMPDQ